MSSGVSTIYSKGPSQKTSDERQEALRKKGWKEQGLFAVNVDDKRLNWTEQELVKCLAQRLYGPR